jgi:glycosyltransferase involved in cell wall biosynthesis
MTNEASVNPPDPPEPSPLVSLLMPAYNEAATIDEAIHRVLALPFRKEVIVVDDGSDDSTPAVLERLLAEGLPGLRVLSHRVNLGKGAAVRRAIAESRGAIVVVQDADLEYDPDDIPRLLDPILQGKADVVYGSRLRGGQPQRAHLFWHYAGNRFLSLLTNLLYNTTISDMEVGYKAFRGDLLRSLPLSSNRFGFEPEVTAGILRRNDVRLYEVPIAYYGRTYAEGKKVTWRDGVAAIFHLVRFRLRRWPRSVASAPRSDRLTGVGDQAEADRRPEATLERAPDR